MDLNDFRLNVPDDKKQQSERMQISVFLQSHWDRMKICDIQFVTDDPPDFIITLQSGLRIGIELKRLQFSEPNDKQDIKNFKKAFLDSNNPSQRFIWKPTTYGIILSNLDTQLTKAIKGGIYERAKNSHKLDQVWLMFSVIEGNPASMFVEYAALGNASSTPLPFPAHNRFAYHIVKLAENTQAFDAIILNSGLYAVAAKNNTEFGFFTINRTILECGKNDPKGLDGRCRIDTGVTHGGYLRWENG